MTRVIVFGTEQTAELAHYYLMNDSSFEVIGFTLSEDYIKENTFNGLPVYPYEKLDTLISTDGTKLFAPTMASRVNHLRYDILQTGKKMGFSFISYLSSKATILSKDIGDNCFILEDNTIQPFVKIEDNCMIWSGNHIGHHSTIKHSSFITSHCVISGNCKIGPYCYLGVNSTIRDNICLEEGTMVGMASSVTANKSQPYCFISGNPGEVHPKLTSMRLLK